MHSLRYRWSWNLVLVISTVTTVDARFGVAQTSPLEVRRVGIPDVLTSTQWKQLERSVDRGLRYISSQQQPDGSFTAPELGQPGITSLCILAYLSRGHLPGEGSVGQQLTAAVRFVISQQRDDGLLFGVPVGPWFYGSPAHTGIYNHAISGLALSEVYGMSESSQATLIREATARAIEFTLNHQGKFHRNDVEQGGWRYLRLSDQRSDADLSISAWQLMFLRSAKNGGFVVPRHRIDDATAYVRRCYDASRRTFTYCIVSGREYTPAMAGAGIVSLSMAGEHQSEIAQTVGRHVLNNLNFARYNRLERYHYSAYYCSQAMFQLGGEYWSTFYPQLMNALVSNQRRDGSWDREATRDGNFGNVYTTALAILALTPPYQQLPIYQR